MSAIAITDDLFFNRAGLDRGRVERIVADALKGADDGELFLEYSQSEALAFDDGKLKSASFDTTQGFGLRAVAGEAAGYAHASDLSRGRASQRAAATVKAVHAGHGGTLARAAAAAPTGSSIPTTTRWPRCRSSAKVKLLAGDRRLCPRQGSARAAGHGLDLRRLAGGADHPRPTAAAPPTSGRWCGSTSPSWSARATGMETGSHGAGGRIAYELVLDPAPLEGAASTRRCARRWSISAPSPPRPARCRWCWAPAGPASCCTRRSATGSKATSTARRPRPSPA